MYVSTLISISNRFVNICRFWLKRRCAGKIGFQIRPGGAVRGLTIFGLSIVAGTLVFGGAILCDMRDDARTYAERASDNLSKALAQDIARNIKQYDLSVLGAIDAWDRPDIRQISPETRRMALFDSAASADYLGSISIADASGVVVASSVGAEGHQLSMADRHYFLVQQQRVDAGMYLSRPFTSRLRQGDPTVAISRRIFGHDGRFGGVVAGTMRLALFRHLFEKLDLGAGGTVTLFRTDGRLIMRTPFEATDIDRDFSSEPVFRRFLASPAGSLIDTAPLDGDGIQRLFTYRRIDDLPLIVSIAIPTSEIYAQWWHKAIAVAAALTVLCGAAVLLLVLFRREILRHLAVEQQLVAMASTDSLTGIANRRSSEQALAREWKRAIRAELPIALLMLDADFFKVFNDTYGHPAGDQVLRAIVDVMVQNIRRPADVAGRYGGEEFIILMPETDAAGALDVATRICRAVADLAIPHAGSSFGYVTISIGVGVAWPILGEPEGRLVKEADAALYQAKRAGRNQIHMGVRHQPVEFAIMNTQNS